MSTYRGEDRYLWKCVKTEIGPSFFSPQVLGCHLVLQLCKGTAVLVISKCAYSPTGCHSILGLQKVFYEWLRSNMYCKVLTMRTPC